jgi:hypothetical protein
MERFRLRHGLQAAILAAGVAGTFAWVGFLGYGIFRVAALVF